MQKNLTAIALQHKSILVYLVLCLLFGGIAAYQKLGRMENPDFTIRQMVITAAWPGATAEQMQLLVLDKIERKLQQTPYLNNLRSYARPSAAVIYVELDGTSPIDQVRPTWQEVRNLTEDVRLELPQGVIGPFFNDRFDDVFGTIYAITGNDYTYEQKRIYAEQLRRQLLAVDDVKRVELIGVQAEQIYIRVEPAKLAMLGISLPQVQQAVSKFNMVTPAGMLETSYDNVYIRVAGEIAEQQLASVSNIPLYSGGRTFRLADVATITREYAQPASARMYANGEAAIGIAVSMAAGGNNIALGEALAIAIEDYKPSLPIGLELVTVADQPKVVADSIDEFARSLIEAVIILLAVSFLSLGVRTGLVISFCIPLVFAGVFVVMRIMGIDLHLVSLGTLIIALGLLVDDEIIAVEMMAVKLEEGMSRFDAACAAYKVTAMPMLAGTFITCAGFIPIGFARGDTAEFTGAIFPVLVAALLISWLVSLTVAPFIGYRLIKVKKTDGSTHDGRFYKVFNKFLTLCLAHRKMVIGITILVFALSVWSMGFIQQQFFPPSKRGELVVDLTLADGSSMQASEQTAMRFASYLDEHPDVQSYSYHVGEGAPRFVTTAQPILSSSNVSQFVIVTEDAKVRDRLRRDLDAIFVEKYPEARVNIQTLNMGPPSEYPVMLKVSGDDPAEVRKLAEAVAARMQQDPNLYNINFDWKEQARAVRLSIDETRLAAMGIDRKQLSDVLYSMVSGVSLGEFYDADRIIDISFRLDEASVTLEQLANIPVQLQNGSYVPLSQLAHISYEAEEVSIWRQDLKPTIMVRANTLSGTENDMTMAAYDSMADLRETLPYGYSIDISGALKMSNESVQYIMEQVPLMLFAIITILMFSLHRFALAVMALLTAPMGMIGVSLSMILTGQPMGFVAQLGIIALSGMIIRNAIILLDQIEVHIKEGDTQYESIIKAAVMRFRPIMLTSVTAILAMIPLMLSNFWGPMAVAISGGLFAGTVLTLVVLPCMYALWYKVK
ncbi:MAG: efflux RND transporter permease subunit [Deferribacteraceae bacterium]|jgi:multidrug efflux pump subunit AcrB|nr:efflux RND transporter permease subunit [Deferribacteraceae bacterium]